MGVDFKDIVKPRKVTLDQLSGETLAIDAYNALYQFLAIIRGEYGEHLTDHLGNVTSHLSGLFYRNVNLLSLGIKPIYILDGMPPSLKIAEIERRREAKQEAVIKYVQALERGNLEEAKKFAQATSVIKDYMIDDTKKILDLLGIPWIEAPSEGEATAAYLSSSGFATAAVSQDFDSLLFGASRLVRNVTISGRRKLPLRSVYVEVEPEEIELNQLLRELGITRQQLVDLAILIGTDFNPDGFRGVGPVKALKYIKTYVSAEKIPEIKEELEKIDYQAIREIFLKPKVAKPIRLTWKELNTEGVVSFLCKEKDFSEQRVRNALSKLEEAQKRKSESLDRFFG